MSKVSDDEVKSIFDTERDTNPFIDTANLVVSEQLTGKGLSDQRLHQITLYLSAHYAAVTDEKGQLKSEKMGDATDTYETTANGSGLASTRYGREAMNLDTSGTLRTMGLSSLKAQFRVV